MSWYSNVMKNEGHEDKYRELEYNLEINQI
jgi:hypothetical protein